MACSLLQQYVFLPKEQMLNAERLGLLSGGELPRGMLIQLNAIARRVVIGGNFGPLAISIHEKSGVRT